MTTRKPSQKRPEPQSGRGRGKSVQGKKPSRAPARKRPDAEPANVVSDNTLERGERIAKVMARAGLCSRREAETWIQAGRVQLNGKVLATPAITVSANDKVLVDGEPLPMRERTRLWLYHKPRGLVTTNKDPEGRPTVFERLPKELPRVLTVGRLDINTEGLLLLTNDGGLARVLELPSTGWLRRYRVRAFGKITQADLDALQDGIAVEGVLYGAIEATLDKEQGGNIWLTVGLREGKNREVKRVLEHLGLTVNRLIRISYGPFQLMDLPDNDVREIRGRILRDQLGEALANEAGADFDAPIFHQPKQDTPKKSPASRRSSESGSGRKTGDRGGNQGKWLTAREGKSETDKRKTAKNDRQDRKQAKRSGAGPRQEKVSPRSKFRMTSEPKPRKEFGEQRRTPQRRIWSEDGLLEDKAQQSRADQDNKDGSRPPKGGGRPRGGGRS
ncbi:pseudouridine synthase [Roseibium album]|uniref:pseudouridine synthase n=1 Tax=Roseibium album TaxID=311410 RepID=UPI00391D147A